jgi:serine/threonine protein kinase
MQSCPTFASEFGAMQCLEKSDLSDDTKKHLTHVVEHDEAECWMMVEPVGERVATNKWTPEMFLDLYRVLHEVHTKAKLVHRDIRPSNIMQFNGRVLLIDWDCAVPVGADVEFSGGLQYATDRILGMVPYETYTASTTDDMESFVKTFFVCTAMHLQGRAIDCNRLHSGDPKKLLDEWKQIQKEEPSFRTFLFLLRQYPQDLEVSLERHVAAFKEQEPEDMIERE